jgi:transposase
LKRSERFRVLPAISVNGYLRNPLVIQGSVTAELFNDWMGSVVIPQCGPDTIFVMDTASIHHTNGLQDVIEQAGMRLEYLPPYSPDLNPIEQSINVLKAWIRRHIDEAGQFLDSGAFLEHAIEEVGSYGAPGWFRDCGYEVM